MPKAKTTPYHRKGSSSTGSSEQLWAGPHQCLALMGLQCWLSHTERHRPHKTSPWDQTNRNNQIWETEAKWKWARGTALREPLTNFLRSTGLMAIKECQIKHRVLVQVQILPLSSGKNLLEYPWKGKVFKKILKPEYYHCYKKGNYIQPICAVL